MSRRIEQVNALVQERVSDWLLRNLELKDVLVTVTTVKTTPDLKHAKVLVSVLPVAKRGTTLEKLRRLTPELNRDLFHEFTMHSVPKISFGIDTLEVEAARIEDILDSIRDESVPNSQA